MNVVAEDADFLLVDDFLSPEALKAVTEQGRTAQYVDWPAPLDGQVYKRVAVYEEGIPEVMDAMEQLLGKKPKLLGMAYRLNYDGEMPNKEIHSDLGWGTHAMVLYLSEPPDGTESGTAFWKHKRTGAERIRQGELDLYHAIKDEQDDASKWEQTAIVPSKINSAIFYKGEMFHSRWPFSAYGSTPEDGRLCVVAFFS